MWYIINHVLKNFLFYISVVLYSLIPLTHPYNPA